MKDKDYSRSERSQLRKSIRAKRRLLSPVQQAVAAQGVFSLLKNSPHFLNAEKLAFYIAIDGELSPHLLVEEAHRLGKQCYLPVLSKDEKDELLFVEYKPDSKLTKEGRFSLSEPTLAADNSISAQALDTVFMPLVAFDAQGSRLGMGKGYYDKCFEFLQSSTSAQKVPKLVGLAHECQRVEKLKVASWDVPLDKIITDLKIYQARQ